MKKYICIIILLLITLVLNELNKNTYNINKLINNLPDSIKYNDKITLTMKFKYEEPVLDNSEYNDVEKNQEIIMKNRQINKKYFRKMNKKILENLAVDHLNFRISEYSPYCFLEFDTYDEYLNIENKIFDISQSDYIETIFIDKKSENKNEESTPGTTRNGDECFDLLPIDDAKRMINVHDTNYTGDGIKVGIVDSGFPDNLTNFSNGEIKDSKTVISNDHTTKVASIIGGTYGIAPESDLYIHTYSRNNEGYNLDDAVE